MLLPQGPIKWKRPFFFFDLRGKESPQNMPKVMIWVRLAQPAKDTSSCRRAHSQSDSADVRLFAFGTERQENSKPRSQIIRPLGWFWLAVLGILHSCIPELVPSMRVRRDRRIGNDLVLWDASSKLRVATSSQKRCRAFLLERSSGPLPQKRTPNCKGRI